VLIFTAKVQGYRVGRLHSMIVLAKYKLSEIECSHVFWCKSIT